MEFRNTISEATVMENKSNPAAVKIRSDKEFMKKHNITHQSHEMRDMGLELIEGNWEFVTEWVPYN